MKHYGSSCPEKHLALTLTCITVPMSKVKRTVSFLSEFSIPLILGVILALIFANVDEHAYHKLLETPIFGENVKIIWSCRKLSLFD